MALQAIFRVGFLTFPNYWCNYLADARYSSTLISTRRDIYLDQFIPIQTLSFFCTGFVIDRRLSSTSCLSQNSKHERSWNSRATYDRRGSNPCITDHIRVCEGKAQGRKRYDWHIASSYGFLHQHFLGFTSQDIDPEFIKLSVQSLVCVPMNRLVSQHQQCQRPSKLAGIFVFPPHSHCHI